MTSTWQTYSFTIMFYSSFLYSTFTVGVHRQHSILNSLYLGHTSLRNRSLNNTTLKSCFFYARSHRQLSSIIKQRIMFLLCNCFFRVIFIVVGVHVRFELVLVGFYSLDRSCEDDRILYYVTIHSPKRSKQNYAHRTPCSVLIKGCCVWFIP